jgi:sugar phosphate isomerase/epimerase
MITRRRFAQALAAAGAIRLRAAEKLNIGIGAFTYHNLSLEGMIQELRHLGIGEIEMSRGEYMLLSHPRGALFESTRAKLDAADIRCVSWYAATINNDSEVDDALRFARILGCRNVSGDATGSTLKTIDRRFADAGISFGIHNHWFPQKFAYESIDDVLGALASLSKNTGSTLDVGQMVACGQNPVEAVRRLAPHLKMVHLKDVKGSGAEINVPLGQGAVNIPAVMAELKRQSYAGLVAIEYEHEGEIIEDMRRQVAYARSLA